jgi:hypothetical protein
MTVLSYGGTAAVVLLLFWAAVRVTPLSGSNPPLAALGVVAVFALIAITPRCGFMFDCGCDWPWNGLHHHCNVFDAHAKLKCPWCDSKVARSLSMLAVFGASGAAAWWFSAGGALAAASARTRFTLGVLAGALAFHLVSLATATLAALATGYPLPLTA